MGRAWKRRERPAPVPEVPGDYKWSSQSYTLKDILASFKLPVVVQCREDTNAEHLQNFFFSLRQPLLLHSRRTSRKVFARCVRKGAGGTIKELLPEVVIPEDYPGWFKISKGLEFSKPIPHKCIETLTRSNAEFFLCTTEFNAVVITDNANGDETDSFQRPVAEGEVLRKTGVRKLNRLLLPEPERSTITDDRFLMCIDERDCELFVPVNQTGLFYEVSDGNFDKNENSVVQVSDILDELVELPIYVRHILGDPPPISTMYLPSLKLLRVKEEETVMGATLECDDDKLPLEIQTNSSLKFEIALNTPMLQSSNEYTEALELCNSVSENYVTEMKLAVNFKMATEDGDETLKALVHACLNSLPGENDNQGSKTNSQRTSITRDSEFGEVEANSEFSIQWEPIPSVPNTPVNQSLEQSGGDCDSLESFESVTSEQAARLNLVLGGPFFETDTTTAEVHKEPETNQCKQRNGLPHSKMISNPQCVQGGLGFNQLMGNQNFLHGNDIIEEITDFSMRRTPKKAIKSPFPPSSQRQYSSFSEGLNTQPNTESKLSVQSNIETGVSRGTTDLASCFPGMNSNKPLIMSNRTMAIPPEKRHYQNMNFSSTGSQHNGRDLNSHQYANLNEINASLNQSLAFNNAINQYHQPYIFTGDVFINNDSLESFSSANQTGSSDDSLPESIGSWDSNKLRMAQPQRLSPSNGRIHPMPDMIPQIRPEHTTQSPDNLISFEDRSRTPSTVSIITCKAADEMISSCKDLRLSLEEITQSAHDNQVENSWNEFCLERSSSLPVRSKNSPRNPTNQNEEHSHSWEQISPRRDDSSSQLSSLQSKQGRAQAKAINKINTDFDSLSSDKTQLISDTSSEDSFQQEDNMADISFALSESDFSVTDGQEDLLAAFEDMDSYLNAQCHVDPSVMNGSTLTRDKAALTQKIKIRREIKRKRAADWNDVEEIV